MVADVLHCVRPERVVQRHRDHGVGVDGRVHKHPLCAAAGQGSRERVGAGPGAGPGAGAVQGGAHMSALGLERLRGSACSQGRGARRGGAGDGARCKGEGQVIVP